MELAILGAVGLLGYTMSTDKAPRIKTRDQPVAKNAHAYPFGPGTQVQALLDADRREMQARWEQAQRPHVTGVITPNTKPGTPLPYFSSMKKQHHSPGRSQRNLETFTGANDLDRSTTGTYRRKREVPSLFKPEWTAAAVNSSGAPASQPLGIDQATRYRVSQKQNNVLPTKQVRVGKGLGVGIDVPAADGFHPMLRIMPKNVGEYKKNTLKGGVIAGSAAVASRPVLASLGDQMKPPTFWDMERYPLAPGKAAVNAASERPFQDIRCGGRLVGDDYFGGGAQRGTYTAATQPSRDRDDNNVATHETNLTGASRGIGAFVNTAYEGTRFDKQQREQVDTYDGVLTGNRAPLAQQGFLVPKTNRDLHGTDIMGNPASIVEGGASRPQDRTDRTLREQLHNQYQPGVAAPYLKGHSVQGTARWLTRDAKRYGNHIVDWMPAPHQATDVRVPGLLQIKPRIELDRTPALPTNPTPSARPQVGLSTTTYNKLPSTNPRLDLSIAKAQLANNSLHISIS